MTTDYKRSNLVPTETLVSRLNELATAVTEGPDSVRRNFTMRVPAEVDRDADLVISEAARRIAALEAEKAELKSRLLLAYRGINSIAVRLVVTSKHFEPLYSTCENQKTITAKKLESIVDDVAAKTHTEAVRIIGMNARIKELIHEC